MDGRSALLLLPVLVLFLGTFGPVSCNRIFRVKFWVFPPDVNEGDGSFSAEMKISRVKQSTPQDFKGNITFTVTATAGTAKENEDFKEVYYSFTILSDKIWSLEKPTTDNNAESITKQFVVAVTDDHIAERDENFTLGVDISPDDVKGVFECVNATVTIVDSDKVRVGFSSEYYITHVNESFQLTIEVEGEIDCNLRPKSCFSVIYSLDEDTENDPKTVTFGEGESQTTVDFDAEQLPATFIATLKLPQDQDHRIKLGRSLAHIEVSLTPKQQIELLELKKQSSNNYSSVPIPPLDQLYHNLTELQQELIELMHNFSKSHPVNQNVETTGEVIRFTSSSYSIFVGQSLEVTVFCHVNHDVDIIVTLHPNGSEISSPTNLSCHPTDIFVSVPIQPNVTSQPTTFNATLSFGAPPQYKDAKVTVKKIDVSIEQDNYTVSKDVGSVEVTVTIGPGRVKGNFTLMEIKQADKKGKAVKSIIRHPSKCVGVVNEESFCNFTVKLKNGTTGPVTLSLGTNPKNMTNQVNFVRKTTTITIVESKAHSSPVGSAAVTPTLPPTEDTGSSGDSDTASPTPASQGSIPFWTWLFVIFIVLLVLGVAVYVTYHNKEKLMDWLGGIVSKGGGGGARRPRRRTGKYKKLPHTIHETVLHDD